MRKIGIGEILLFFTLLLTIISLAILNTKYLLGGLPFGDFRGVVLILGAIAFAYAYALAIYRLFMMAVPLHEGEITENSREEFGYHVYVLFYLILFYPLMRSGFIPIPFMRLIYLALGARLGDNTYSAGIILDPPFVEIGANSAVGQYALLVPHVIESKRLAHYKIRIGNNVTVGAHAVVLSGVSIGDNAIVATGAVVPKGTVIGPNEVWGGVPARLIRGGLPSE
jgi:acetyltransferase-like isoleucine patch superfamily enzyme